MEAHTKTMWWSVIGAAVLSAVLVLWSTGRLNSWLPFFLTTDGWNVSEREMNNPSANGAGNDGRRDRTSVTLTEVEARTIAEGSCVKGGHALSGGGTYNPNSKTWWFDANLNTTREGCLPACVVSEATQTAEINWRCTGLIVPDRK